MDIIVFLGVMIEWPWLALVPACAFALAWVRCRRASVLVAAIAWLASGAGTMPSQRANCTPASKHSFCV